MRILKSLGDVIAFFGAVLGLLALFYALPVLAFAGAETRAVALPIALVAAALACLCLVSMRRANAPRVSDL